MNRYYDAENNRLVYENEAATPDYWDRQWNSSNLKKEILSGANDRFVYPTTKKFLPPKKSTKILEGGCGKGRFVYSLDNRGYDAYGIDFAEKTVANIKAAAPNLKVSVDDVRHLGFSDDYFDGYWSLGVIEHFFGGYEPIRNEMCRVLKKDGILFLTFPYISPIRKIRIAFGSYPPFEKNGFKEDLFYQFALDHNRVIRDFTSHGFDLLAKKPLDGFKGLKDESGIFKKFLQKIYDNKSLPSQALSYLMMKTLAPLTGHSILLVFKKK